MPHHVLGRRFGQVSIACEYHAPVRDTFQHVGTSRHCPQTVRCVHFLDTGFLENTSCHFENALCHSRYPCAKKSSTHGRFARCPCIPVLQQRECDFGIRRPRHPCRRVGTHRSRQAATELAVARDETLVVPLCGCGNGKLPWRVEVDGEVCSQVKAVLRSESGQLSVRARTARSPENDYSERRPADS